MSKARKLIIAAIALLTMGGAATAQTTPEASTTNIVLVHGAFVDGSGWRAVHDILKKDGYRVGIVQQPLTSLADDVAATKRVLAQWFWSVTAMAGRSFRWPGPTRRSALLFMWLRSSPTPARR